MNAVQLAIVVFLVSCLVDVFSVYWMRANSESNEWLAGLTSMLIQLVAATSIVLAVNDPALVIFSALGHGTGSVIAIRKKKRDERNKNDQAYGRTISRTNAIGFMGSRTRNSSRESIQQTSDEAKNRDHKRD